MIMYKILWPRRNGKAVIKSYRQFLIKNFYRDATHAIDSRGGSGLHFTGSGRARVETVGLGLFRALRN
jgi:hypothetical protein